jgi:hypothetical protein
MKMVREEVNGVRIAFFVRVNAPGVAHHEVWLALDELVTIQVEGKVPPARRRRVRAGRPRSPGS